MTTTNHPEPYAHGMLDVGDGQLIYWEECGNPDGTPLVVLHGGPGAGCSAGSRRIADPSKYRIVLFDQRGCGRSTPHAADPETDLSVNTTHHLIADIERLREHRGIDRWVVWGGSWGVTLAFAYAERFPERVRAMVLIAITNTTRREVRWITRDVGRIFPEAWERFRDGVPPHARDGDLAAAYAELLASPDPAIREQAALDWCTWEDVHVSLQPGHKPHPRFEDPRFRMCFARLVTHYWSHAAFLPDGVLLRDAGRLAGIPGVMIHGRIDVSGPLDVAWEMARAWPDAELVVLENAGHSSGDGMPQALEAAFTRFADAV